jgi:hypothetical protein
MIPVGSILDNLPKECRALFDHWDRLRGDRLLPARAEIDPGAIKPLLPFIFILESRAPNEARIRLAGTGLRDLFGFETTGRNLVKLAPPEQRRERSYRMWTVMRQPCAAHYTHHVAFPTGVREICQGIALPMAPNKSGGSPLAIAVEIPQSGRRWLNPSGPALITIAEEFAFIDIGAGHPESVAPPDDWTIEAP